MGSFHIEEIWHQGHNEVNSWKSGSVLCNWFATKDFSSFQEPAATHLFSKHDNRHSFMDDALYFEQVSTAQWS